MRTIITSTFVLAVLLLPAGSSLAQNATPEAPRRDRYMGTFPDSGSMVIESGPGQDTVIQSRPAPKEENRTREYPLIIVPEVRVGPPRPKP
ncbi:hypothetical protein DPQ33_03530 [Oceanidesulfovibrio indonesiensis]|uniref:Secreted protein n=1 Tax=Oceanidesulfovibrio indonesiensis TaxID=54767 RepID=A0A7M3MIC6_9BACT|nr:hypothetical protein [Oceanidesulfovibrio indonesiensis]TVM19442.1 hypothetical protein DPQ33_03530 [Oceanidesulfovibrio indonesiensis]